MSRRAEALFDSGSRTEASENGFVISPTFASAKHPLPPRNAPSNMVKNSSRAASASEKTESHKKRPFPHVQWVVKKPV